MYSNNKRKRKEDRGKGEHLFMQPGFLSRISTRRRIFRTLLTKAESDDKKVDVAVLLAFKQWIVTLLSNSLSSRKNRIAKLKIERRSVLTTYLVIGENKT
ncbi:hypothetical protein I7I48_11082 [Histoplasma ohiense]|nr:hypothetical protein I7I48_11082 [Histoplasma ohiense (nom. inval.)]